MRNVFLALLFILSTIAGCSTSRDPLVPQELKSSEKGGKVTPEDELFEQGMRLYGKALYSVAKQSFLSLKEQYPLSAHAEFAELRVADCDFETEQYKEAALAYDEFLKNRAASVSLPYALYRAALSYQRSYGGEGRDPQPLETARARFVDLFQRFPRATESTDGRHYYLQALEQLRAHELFVATFYEKRGAHAAAATRQSRAEELWTEIEKLHGQLAGELPTKPLPEVASKAEDVQPPETPPLQVAEPVAVQSQEVPSGSATISPTSSDVPLTEALPSTGMQAVLSSKNRTAGEMESLKVACVSEKQLLVVVPLTRDLTPDEIGDLPKEILPENQVIKASSSALQGTGILSCFETGDLEIRDGNLSLRSSSRWAVFAMRAPARLILTQMPDVSAGTTSAF